MLKSLYRRYPYFFNMFAVLVFLTITRILDSFAWYPPSPQKVKFITTNSLFEFVSFIPFIFLLIISCRWAIKRKRTFLLWFIIVASTLIIPTLVLILSGGLALLLGFKIQNPFSFVLIEKYTPGVGLEVLFLTATYFLTHLVLQTAKQKEEAFWSESLAKDVQLKMLRYQINPHFLFNVLNSIYTLIDENTEKAKKLVIDMSEYYRYTLNKQQQTTTTIEKEVDSIIKYLEIQKTRFEEEFHYEISVGEEVKSFLIPSFIVHLLIENAVKYGTKTMKEKLIICLSVKQVNKMLFIKVSNTGKLLNGSPPDDRKNDGTGNGIDNLKFRLALYYNDNYSFSLKEEDGWVVADIKINYAISDDKLKSHYSR
jgi:two-component system, LytTR family, sensor kinase